MMYPSVTKELKLEFTATMSHNCWTFRYKQDVEYHDVSLCNRRIQTDVYGYNDT